MSIGYGGIVLVRFEEYIVAIPFTLLSPYLRRLHLLKHQVTYVHLPWRYRPWRFEDYIFRILHCLIVYIYAASIYWSTCPLQGVHCWYPLPRSLSISAPPSSTGAPCHFRPVAIEIVLGASRSTFSAFSSLLTRPHLRRVQLV